MSKLSKALTLLGLMPPLTAAALGIGDIRPHSNLNEALSADIPLVLSGNDSLDSIKVTLASPEAFAKAGVERPHILSQLRFKPVRISQGRYTIQVNSTAVIQDPYLDFLIEVESTQGSMLREFTLLLDPPNGFDDAVAGGGWPSMPPADRLRELSSPEVFEPDDTPPIVRPIVRNPESAWPKGEQHASRSTRADQLTGQTYGPVQAGERLIDIAGKVERPATVSIAQMMTGLYRANPHAFSRNINGLMAGSTLQIPTADFIRGESSLASPATEQAAELSQSVSHDAVAEVVASNPAILKKENEALRARLVQLELRLGEAQRMLSLKNAELAALQSHHEGAVDIASMVPVIPPVSLIRAVEEDKTTKQSEDSQASDDATVAASTPVPAPAVQSQPAISTNPIPQGIPIKNPAKAPVALPPAAMPKTSPLDIDYILGSSSLLLLGLGAWLLRRRRLHASITDPEVMPEWARQAMAAAQRNSDLAEPSPYDPTGMPSTAVPNSAETQPIELEPGSDSTVLDPVWEADVYLRYGRYDQADTLIRQALVDAPDQPELMQKRFEIFDKANNEAAFRAYANSLLERKVTLPESFWSDVYLLRPEWLTDSLPNTAGHPSGITLAQPPTDTATPHPASAALNADDTDFMAELQAFEAEYAETVSSNEMPPIEDSDADEHPHDPDAEQAEDNVVRVLEYNPVSIASLQNNTVPLPCQAYEELRAFESEKSTAAEPEPASDLFESDLFEKATESVPAITASEQHPGFGVLDFELELLEPADTVSQASDDSGTSETRSGNRKKAKLSLVPPLLKERTDDTETPPGQHPVSRHHPSRNN
ncbi:MAG: FimV family protein [Methylococcaceae bacterium]|jgi:pilus assembly protein FimV